MDLSNLLKLKWRKLDGTYVYGFEAKFGINTFVIKEVYSNVYTFEHNSNVLKISNDKLKDLFEEIRTGVNNKSLMELFIEVLGDI